MGPRSAAHAWLAYAGPSFAEQSRVVGALSLILWLFQTLVLRQPVYHPERVLFGLLLVSCGLFVFLEGVKLGVQPLASELGATLPKQLKLRWVLLVVFVLGCGATLAEPAMGALRNLDKLISPSRAPLLNAMLSRYTVAPTQPSHSAWVSPPSLARSCCYAAGRCSECWPGRSCRRSA